MVVSEEALPCHVERTIRQTRTALMRLRATVGINNSSWKYVVACGPIHRQNHTYLHIHKIRHISFTVSLVSPRGDGPLPEVGAIPGQPVKETKHALCILLVTKI